MLGFLNLHKPEGLTSHDCVAKVRRILQVKRVGHGGTLDPAATGVLPIAAGRATRLLQFLPDAKVYRARVRFGIQTNTDDLEGEVLAMQPLPELSLQQVLPLLERFSGAIEQVPPQFSAIQCGGKRLYELARAGEVADVPSRTVVVSRIDVLKWHPGDFPELELEIACGPGTYIRAIARDLGAALGIGGTLAQLVRTQSCGLCLQDSLTLDELAARVERQTLGLLAPDAAIGHLPAVTFPAGTSKRWCQGQHIPLEVAISPPNIAAETPVRVYNMSGMFLGVAIVQIPGDRAIVSPKVVLV
ncbi:tRNA pseudouridine 55 synthase [Rubidibacter lacunae KORDI 51-2]|uniref:tRNA pseudouridine synthase B n=1 Tax=Rubidibacter lacunae KORDI 51-2 TaxID=582515 RepID=U5DMA1_9CHRO|nr:tRNA pseudouridine(55) synthase TruB [Rubidibacter lacunae]ERN42806.1 tRNA pseudouridine 55 synthase [Rubidibacter lacunae KORDI 51-2]